MKKKSSFALPKWRLKRYMYAITSILVCVLCVSACSPSKEDAPIRLGVNVWPGYEYLFLAREKGFYKQEGLNLQLVETGSLDDLRRAFERGKLDGMAASAIEVVQAAANTGRVAQIFMIPDFSNGADVIIAKDPTTKIIDLKGKKVGLELASLGEFMVARALQVGGLDLSDVQVVPMSQEEMLRGMQEGKVDAVMTYPPVSIELLKESNHNVIFSSADIPGEVMDVVTLSSEVLEERPGAAVKILKAWQRALDFANNNPDEAHRIAADREGITPAEFKDALNGVKLLSIADQQAIFQQEGKIENVLSVIKNVALDKDEKVPDVGDFIYSRALMSMQ